MPVPMIPGLGPQVALAFSDTAVSLMRRTGGQWRVVDQVAIDASDFEAKATALTRHLGRRREVALWLPPGHVLSVRLDPVDAQDVSAALAARVGLDPLTLTTVVLPQPSTGDSIVFAVDRTTLGEAIGFARSWGFVPVSATVRPDSVPGDAVPHFTHPDLTRTPARWAVAGALGAAAAALLVAFLSASPERPSAPSAPAVPVVIEAAMAPPDMQPPRAPVVAGSAQAAVPRRPSVPVNLAAAPERSPSALSTPGAPPPVPERATVTLTSVGPFHAGDLAVASPRFDSPMVSRSMPTAPQGGAEDVTDHRHAPRPATGALADEGLLALPGGISAAEADAADADAALQMAAIADPADPGVGADARAAPPSSGAAFDIEPAAEAPIVTAEPALAAMMEALGTVMPPPRPEQPVIVGITAPRPVARPRSIATAARADREAQAARVAAASRAAAPSRDPAPAEVGRMATVQRGLPADETGLIGVFANGNNRTALLRLSDGRVTRVRRGDTVEGWTVSSIDSATVRLTGRSGARTLRVPTR